MNEFTNGIVTYVHNLRRELLSQGHRVSVFANHIGSSNSDKGIHLVAPTLSYRLRRRLGAFTGVQQRQILGWGAEIAAAVNRVHKSDPLDVLEMEESFGWCAAVRDRIAVPVVVKLHGPAFLTLVAEDRETNFAATKIAAEGAALKRIDAIVSPSAGTLRETIARFGLRPSISEVIPNPVMTDDALRPWSADSCEGKSLLFVGRFDKPKGGDTVLIAFRRLLDVDPELKLIFVGPDSGLTSPGGKRVFFEQFRDETFPPALRSRIEFLGMQPREKLHGLRNRAMLTLVVSRWENQPNTALEAMIQGCPVVGLGGGGMDEVIEHNRTGLLADVGDIGELCRLVMELVGNPLLAARLGALARSVVKDRHAPERLAASATEVYKRAIRLRQGVTLAP